MSEKELIIQSEWKKFENDRHGLCSLYRRVGDRIEIQTSLDFGNHKPNPEQYQEGFIVYPKGLKIIETGEKPFAKCEFLTEPFFGTSGWVVYTYHSAKVEGWETKTVRVETPGDKVLIEQLQIDIKILKDKIEFLKAQRNEIVYHYTNDINEVARHGDEFNTYYGEK